MASLFTLFLFFRAAPPPPPPTYADLVAPFEQYPPIVKNIWVQKLPSPLMDGSNMAMRIEYEEGIDIPDTLEIFYGSGNSDYVTFNDRGDNADNNAGDRIYSAYINENLVTFVAKLEAMEAQLASTDSFLYFNGHVGELITALPAFDANAFNDGVEVQINPILINGVDCSSSILKQNSLFITDLAVVEDAGRTFNVVNETGNPFGAWTFGQLMKNIANESYTGISAKALLKKWLERWTDSTTINGQGVSARRDALRHMIGPWCRKHILTLKSQMALLILIQVTIIIQSKVTVLNGKQIGIHSQKIRF